MRKTKVLVTGANGDIAMCIGRVICSEFPQWDVQGADIGELWPGKSVFSEMHTLPRATSVDYLSELKELVRNCEFELVIPVTEPELSVIANNYQLVKHLPLLMNSPDILKIGLDKQLTSEWLSHLGVSVPFTKPLGEAGVLDLPLFSKPRIGSGSRGLNKVYSREHLSILQASQDLDNYVAQELLEPSEGEYTCALFKACGSVRLLIMERWLTGGMTGKMVVRNHTGIKSALISISDALPNTAVINVQLRLVKGAVKIFEINPRLSSTVMMRHKIGFSDLVWWLKLREGELEPYEEVLEGVKAYRTYGELIVGT